MVILWNYIEPTNLNLKLSNSQLNKFKPGIKVTLELS